MSDDQDTLQYRLRIWEREYSDRQNLPSSKTDFPSRALKTFLEQFPGVGKTWALDLGSGNGRNTIYLANSGFKNVVGIEFVRSAVEQSKNKALENGFGRQVTFINQSVGEKIDYPENTFDLIVDMMVMHALVKEDRERMVDQIKKLLKPGGYLVFYTIAAESPAAQVLISKNPGPETNSYRFQVDGDSVTEKTFTKEELTQMFTPLEMITIEPKEEFTPAFGDVYKRLYYYGVFKKPE